MPPPPTHGSLPGTGKEGIDGLHMSVGLCLVPCVVTVVGLGRAVTDWGRPRGRGGWVPGRFHTAEHPDGERRGGMSDPQAVTQEKTCSPGMWET